MKHFLFYTTEGLTQAPSGQDVNNCQILGFIDASDVVSAWEIFSIR